MRSVAQLTHLRRVSLRTARLRNRELGEQVVGISVRSCSMPSPFGCISFSEFPALWFANPLGVSEMYSRNNA
jgi:hypothetical protein